MTDFDLIEMEIDLLRRDIERLKDQRLCKRDLRAVRDMAARLIEIANASETANADR